jgi:hypothetical protein
VPSASSLRRSLSANNPMDYHANPVAAMKRAQVGTVGCNVSIRMHRASTVERKLKVPWKDGSSALAVTGLGWVLRQQCGGLLTMAASSDPTAASSIYELTLRTRKRHFQLNGDRRLSRRQRTFVFTSAVDQVPMPSICRVL